MRLSQPPDWRSHGLAVLAFSLAAMTYSMPSQAQDTDRPAFDLHHIASLRQVSEAVMAPDGGRIAYVVSVPRDLHREDDGPPWSCL